MWGTDQKEINCIYTLTNEADRLLEREEQLEITDISWNSTGLTLAASYLTYSIVRRDSVDLGTASLNMMV